MSNFVSLFYKTASIMRKFLFYAMIAIVAFAAKAQHSDIDVEVVAGVNSANISYGGIVSRTGFHAGLRLSKDLKFFTEENAIYSNVGALLSLKGGKEKTDDGNIIYNPYYLEVPVHVGYSYQANPNYKFYFEMGPYLAVGLFGKTEGATVFGDLDFRRFDVGAGFRTGVQIYKHYSLSLGYDVGFINVQKGTGANKNFYLSAGYKF